MKRFSFILYATLLFLGGLVTGLYCGYVSTKADIEQRAISAGAGKYIQTSKGNEMFVFVEQ